MASVMLLGTAVDAWTDWKYDADMSTNRFGVFEPLLDANERYLPLLKGGFSTGFGETMDIIFRIVDQTAAETLNKDIVALLSSPDWRPHIVAIVTMYVARDSCEPDTFDAAWMALHGGSWVSPQICLVLSLIDPGFGDRALRMITASTEIVPDAGLSIIHSHVAQGPAGVDRESTKLHKALRYCLDGTQTGEGGDYDGGGIAHIWRQYFLQYFESDRQA